MKRIISFDITVNSYFPKPIYSDQPNFPVGGTPETRKIKFEVDKIENSMKAAEKALAKEMGGTPYHIWYWTWIK